MFAGLILSLFVSQADVTTVSVDLRGLSEAKYRRVEGVALERKVTVRLVQDGFGVLSPDQPSVRVRVTVLMEGRELALKAEGPLISREERVALDHRSVAELHLEVAQKISALVRATGIAPPPAEEPAPAQPVVVVPRVTEPPAPLPAEPAQRWEVAAAAVASFRRASPDPLVILSLRRAFSWLAVDAELGGSASRSGGVGVWEARLAVGASHRFLVTPRFGIEARIAAGALLHSYHLESTELDSPQGALLLPAGWARLSSPWNAWGPVWLEPFVAGCLTRPVEHRSDGISMWQQGVARVEAGVAVRWGL